MALCYFHQLMRGAHSVGFIKTHPVNIGRTIYQTDDLLFQTLLNKEDPKESRIVDQRLLVMVAIGILNRKFNLEEFLIAVIGQKWRFKRAVEIGETLSVNYEIHENANSKRFIYDIKIEVTTIDETVAEGVWQIMLNKKL